MRSISANIVSYLEDGDKLRIMDVGALGGTEHQKWLAIQDRVLVYGFEPLKGEVECLSRGSGSSKFATYLPIAVGGKSGKQKFFESDKSGQSSLLKQKIPVLDRYTIFSAHCVEPASATITDIYDVDVLTLNDIKERFSLPSVEC